MAEIQNPLWRSDTKQKVDDSQFIIFSGNSNRKLAESIAEHLGTTLGKAEISRFADGEVSLNFKESMRGKHVFIIQSTSTPVNENLVELLLMISTCKRSHAKSIISVVPYYGYARQDRKVSSRQPISAADVAKMLEVMGTNKLITVDLHSGQTQGFFSPNTPTDNLSAQISGLRYFKDKDLYKPVIVSPDAGGVYRARKFQEGMLACGVQDVGIAMFIKQRERPNEIEQMIFVGKVENSDVIIVDDMIDTAGTLVEAAKELQRNGARKIFAFATHGLFNGKAVERLQTSCIEEIIATDSIQWTEEAINSNKIKQISIGKYKYSDFLAPLLAEAIRRCCGKESLENLYK